MQNSNAFDNILLNTDSYKLTHAPQYPALTQRVYSYFESRGGRYEQVVFFGLQYLLKRYLEGQVVTQEKIEEAAYVAKNHFGNEALFNRAGWEYILRTHKGRLPVRIKAVPEGSVIPTHNVLMTVENTDPNCYWLTNYLETLLVQVWYPCTVATVSYHARGTIGEYLEATGNPGLIDFKLHDFGFRGVSSVESAAIGGAAHLLSFRGTDTLAALQLARRFYHEPMAGYSIPASEHSTITSWGKENELFAFRNMLEQYPTGLVACVSDSYDIYNACSELWGKELREKVLSRDGTLVVRPDSGDPEIVVVEVLKRLGAAFGTRRNQKGYLVLNDKVRVIQGDGVNPESIKRILEALKDAGYSADNLAFGMGGALLQQLNRDTQKFAFKASSVTIDGSDFEVFKDPVTDKGKQSKKGRLSLVRTAKGLETVASRHAQEDDLLQTVFHDGQLTNETTFEDVRKRVSLGLGSLEVVA